MATPEPISGAFDDDTAFRKSSFCSTQANPPNPCAASTGTPNEGLEQTTLCPGVLQKDLKQYDAYESRSSGDFFALHQLFFGPSNTRHRQSPVTSSDHLSPRSTEPKSYVPNATDVANSVQAEKLMKPSKAGNKRRKSRKTNEDTSSTIKRARTIADKDDPDGTNLEKAKRDKLLERNRIAAQKCRQKKRVWMTEIDNAYRDLSARNKSLHAEVRVLRDTMFELKNMLFLHSDCGFDPIGKFIKTEAKIIHARARSRSDSTVLVQTPHQRVGLLAQPDPNFSDRKADVDVSYGPLLSP